MQRSPVAKLGSRSDSVLAIVIAIGCPFLSKVMRTLFLLSSFLVVCLRHGITLQRCHISNGICVACRFLFKATTYSSRVGLI